MEQTKKIAKRHDNSLENEQEVKIDDGSELSDMDKLPNEILMEILSYFDEQQLVKCRLLNSRWNEICCLLLPDKGKDNLYSKLVVRLEKNQKWVPTLDCTTVKKGAFTTFLKCFSPSGAGQSHRPIPFSSFSVKDLQYLDAPQITQFVSTFGPNIKSLTLDIQQQDCKNFQKFWKLLLKFAPNIQHLGIGGDYWLNKLKLFDSKSNVKGQTDSFLQNIKSIKVLKNYGFGGFEDFVKQLFHHTPNVQKVLNKDSFYLLGLWQEFNRAHLLKKLKIHSNFQSDLPPVELMKNLQLEDLSACCRFSSDPADTSATNFVSHALKSSQETLSKLNLWHLTKERMNLCFKDIKSLPNVRQFRIQMEIEISMDLGNVVERFRQLCPNVQSLDLGYLYADCFPNVAKTLWTGFKGLKSLKSAMYVSEEEHIFLVDSAISGYSQKSIQNIQAKLKDGISVEEARRGESQAPSILDLKNLSRLDLYFYNGDEKEKLENQLRNSVFVKILPQHIKEYPRSILYQRH